MSSKRKATGKAGPAKKQAKVDPVLVAVEQINDAVEGDLLSSELPPKLIKMVVSSTSCLELAADERTPLEDHFAQLVGKALQKAGTQVTALATAAVAELAAEEGKTAVLQQAVEQSSAVKAGADAAAQAAAAAEKAAKEAQGGAQAGLTAQQEGEGALGSTKAALDARLVDLQFALATAEGPEPAAKDSKRMAATLKKAGAAEAMLTGLVPAVGKASSFEQMVVAEAAKFIRTQTAEAEGQCASHATHTQQMAAKTQQMADEVAALVAAHEQAAAALKAAKAAQKAAQQGVKDAEEAKKAGAKALAKARDESAAAAERQAEAAATCATYATLYARNSADSMAPEPTEPADVAEPAEAATSPKKASPKKATPKKATPKKVQSPSKDPSPSKTGSKRASTSGIRSTKHCLLHHQLRAARCAEFGADYAPGWACDRCDLKSKPGENEPFQHCDTCGNDYCAECIADHNEL